MKKYLNIILTLYFFILSAAASIADCSSGFACSVLDLEDLQKEHNIQILNNINEYFDKTVNEDMFFVKESNNLNYKDLFIYHIIV